MIGENESFKTGSISKLSTKCENCPDCDNCDNKRMEMCAYIIPNMAGSSINAISPSANSNVEMGKINIGIQPPTLGDIAEQLQKQLQRQARRCAFKE